jgi:hypothetical protein
VGEKIEKQNEHQHDIETIMIKHGPKSVVVRVGDRIESEKCNGQMLIDTSILFISEHKSGNSIGIRGRLDNKSQKGVALSGRQTNKLLPTAN